MMHIASHGSSSERIHTSICMVIHGALSLIRLLPFYFFLFLLSVPVFLFHLELFPELLYTKDMANLRLSTHISCCFLSLHKILRDQATRSQSLTSQMDQKYLAKSLCLARLCRCSRKAANIPT